MRQRGFDALAAPVLRFEPLPFHDDDDAEYDAVILTSANALRAVDLGASRLMPLPLFAVGTHTADAARAAGFDKVIVAKGD
ncbi:MAG TPA: uroporphyrinogen III synthase, partial [Bradyrhizobium sp.]|nr:uroporphyrinogen III synthase [Bradyrhizobium sp.]